MGLRAAIGPLVAQAITSTRLRDDQRRRFEAARIRRGQPHGILYFHQADDPYSALMAERLEGVFERTAKSMGEPDGKTDAAVAAWSTMLGGLLLARVFGPGARGDEILAIARQAALAQEPPRDAG